MQKFSVQNSGKLVTRLVRACALALVPLADSLVHPHAAHAVFFENARLWLNALFISTGNVTAGVGVDMTVNVLRAVLLIWIALGIVRTVQAARNDEDDIVQLGKLWTERANTLPRKTNERARDASTDRRC